MSKTIYREPLGIESLYVTTPVWATESALRVQSRLLSVVLLNPAGNWKAVWFPSYWHGVIFRAVRKARSFLDYLATCCGEVLDVLIRVSEHWVEKFTEAEIKSMRDTVARYWRLQQSALSSLDAAARAWKGKQ